jgi:hypothetical protein
MSNFTGGTGMLGCGGMGGGMGTFCLVSYHTARKSGIIVYNMLI